MAPNWGPRIGIVVCTGLKNGTHFFDSALGNHHKAAACWKWANFAHHAGTPEHIVRVNMDETHIPFQPPAAVGLLSNVAKKQKRSARGLVNAAKSCESRAGFTYVCMITDDAALLQHLPQVLLVNKNVVTAAEINAALTVLPSNVVVIYGETAWMNSDLMITVLNRLAHTVRRIRPGAQLIVCMDTFRAHMTRSVWKTCCDLQIRLHLVPSKMTWILQPCDTHVFARFKRRLQTECMERKLTGTDGVLTRLQLFQSLGASIEKIIRGQDWSRAFSDTGLTGNQSAVTGRVLDKMGVADMPIANARLPTFADLQEVFPGRADIPVDIMFQVYLTEQAPVEPTDAGSHRIITRSVAALAPTQTGAASSSAAAPTLAGASCPVPPAAPTFTPLSPAPRLSPRPMLRLPSSSRLPSVPPKTPPGN